MLFTSHLTGREEVPFRLIWSRPAPAECSRGGSKGPQELYEVQGRAAQEPGVGDKPLAQLDVHGNLLGGSHLNWAAGASGAAALLTCCVLHPFDLIKTRMQVASGTGGAIPLYSSSGAAVVKIFEQEGFRGLWKGVGVTAVASSISWSCFRYAFDSLSLSFPGWRKTLFGTSDTSSKDGERVWLDDMASGLLAGAFVTGLTHPLWLVKARMEMQAKETEFAGWPHFRNGFSCIVAVAHGGVKECYRGIGPALALVPHAAIQIAVYERLKKKHIAQSSSTVPPGMPALWGAISKFAALSFTYPLQVLRSRQQVHNTPYRGLNFLQLGVRVAREEGILSLFGGYWVYTQRACLQSGIMFLVYEKILSSAR